MRRAHLRQILFLVTFWGLSALFSVGWEGAIRRFQAPDPTLPYSFPREMAIIFLVALLFGTVVASFDVLILSRILRKRPFGLTLLAKTGFYLTCIVVVVSLAVLFIRGSWQGLPFYDRDVVAALAFFLVYARVNRGGGILGNSGSLRAVRRSGKRQVRPGRPDQLPPR